MKSELISFYPIFIFSKIFIRPSPVDMKDPTGIMFHIKRGGRHMVDDRTVAFFPILFQHGNCFFYRYGNQKFSGTTLPFKISNLHRDIGSSLW